MEKSGTQPTSGETASKHVSEPNGPSEAAWAYAGNKVPAYSSGTPASGPSGAPAPAYHAEPSAKRSIGQVVKSYFYWTYSRGSLHYDVMVTLILLFIFITPLVWDFGDKPATTSGNSQPLQIMGDGRHGLIVTLPASDVIVPPTSSDSAIKKALRKAMEPVLGDAVYVVRWELTRDQNGNPQAWKVWAHR